MDIHVYWEDDQKIIIRQVYDMTWTWEEFVAAIEEIRRLESEVAHPIGMISEIGRIKSVPSNAILHGSRAIRRLPEDIVLTVVVTTSPLILSLLSVILTLTQFKNIKTAPSVTVARLMIMRKLGLSTDKTLT